MLADLPIGAATELRAMMRYFTKVAFTKFLAGIGFLLAGCGEDELNLPPVAETVVVVGQFDPGSQITGRYSYSDPEGDAEGESLFQWYFASSQSGEDKELVVGANTVDFTIEEEFVGKFLAFEVIPVASSGTTTGSPVISAFRGVNNTPPAVSEVMITGDLKYEKTLTVSYNYTDLEGDPEGGSKIQWYRADDADGTGKTAIEGAENTNYTLKVADISRYMLVEVTPVASSGATEGTLVESSYTAEVTSDLREGFTVKDYNKKIVGFYPSYKQTLLPINEVKWSELTHLIYAFAIPLADGSINVSSLNNVSEFVSTAHLNGVEAFFSIGGGSGSEGFVELAANAETRRKFVELVEEYAYINNFDGVDIDWEHWSGFSTGGVDEAESQSLLDLLKELRAALSRHGIKISIDLFATDFGGKHYLSALYDYVDWAHIMAYDFSGSFSSEPGPHSSLDHAMEALSYWGETRGLPKSKTILGVAFYGKEFTDVDNINSNTVTNLAYRDILNSHPDAHLSDQIGEIYYTGIQTIKDKAAIISNDNDYQGVMVWEIAHDTPDASKSLLTALDQVLNQ